MEGRSKFWRFLRRLALAAAVLGMLAGVVFFAGGSLLSGIGGLHGPGRHAPSGDAGGDTPRSSVTEDTALSVTVATIGTRRMEKEVLATGTVVAWEELPVSAEVAGLAITEVLIDEGDRVEKGQLLASLNDIQLQAQIEQQKAWISEAEASLDAAQAELRRGQELTARNAISKQDAESRNTAVRTAQARLAVAQAGLSQLNAKLAQTSIVAPADGYVSKKSAVLGQVVQMGSELLRIVRDGRLEVEARVSEGDLFGVAPGQAVRITDPAGRVIEATVRTVAPIVDPRTRLGTVYIALPRDSGLKPGMFARAEIAADQPMALAVPQKALVWRNGQNAVFAVRNGTASLRPVKTGMRRDGWIEITDGLTPGDRLAIDGAGFLKDGDSVRVELAEADPALVEDAR
ncbi:efflux RND transporter periplasmic adaptor subunit [Chelativorans xinjiangense]|uniref:efflux RND transporter periplasmic adaptor subunit n=1 Tax=Chelativorans xinjiangense TaxID=2681485 RepID=UPI001356D33E|nr:efflux RND transporter periplasmic adaptor subunit [Chelativorans xinjiangense]